ncbi:outer membrane protein transport protein [Flavobacterium filum]|uniref:OmpP1/FadL family transporter n=1 Tax=Flavobacterium filum TaxID=370974 RepID=UPI0023F4D0A2|nr:outer membrane protein transport protein [Flavobacterium filum]
MKKITFTTILLLSSIMYAQDIQDAIRYSQENLNGTARFNAMGGAFGALGGDLSSIAINPAGSAIFMNSQVGLSLNNNNFNNRTNYFGSKNRESENAFDFNQISGVWVLKDESGNPTWKKIAFALTYENKNNFNNAIFSSGTNPNTSIDRYFLNYANGIPLGTITSNSFGSLNYAEQQAFLGYEGYVISPLTSSSSNTSYLSEVPEGGNYYQENYVITEGFNGKVGFNAAAQYDDKLYIGINLNAHFVDFTRSSSFFESNSNDTQNGVQQLRFDNYLYTYGTGFSFQLGAIYKVTQSLRLGAAYESPTWLSLNDEFSQRLQVVNRFDGETFNDNIDPNIISIYPTYRLQTPGKVSASIAYVFQKRGLISFDYSFKDYSSIKFRPENEFRIVNDQMTNLLTTANEFRLGAEYKIKEWSLRGGYRFEESPYKDSKTIGDLTAYSAGIGYNFGSTKLDLSYSLSQRKSREGFFTTGLTSPSLITTRQNAVTATLLFEL